MKEKSDENALSFRNLINEIEKNGLKLIKKMNEEIARGRQEKEQLSIAGRKLEETIRRFE